MPPSTSEGFIVSRGERGTSPLPPHPFFHLAFVSSASVSRTLEEALSPRSRGFGKFIKYREGGEEKAGSQVASRGKISRPLICLGSPSFRALSFPTGTLLSLGLSPPVDRRQRTWNHLLSPP